MNRRSSSRRPRARAPAAPQDRTILRSHSKLGLLLALLVGLGAGVYAYVAWNSGKVDGDSSAEGLFGPSRPPGDPPIDAASVLGLPAKSPQTVAELKDEAFAIGRQLVAALPREPQAHAQMAYTYLQLGQDREALSAWRKAVELQPDFAAGHLGIGTLLAGSGQEQAAIEALSEAIRLDPSSEPAYRQLVELLLRAGNAKEALPLATDAVRRFPQSSYAHFWLGQCHLQLGDYAAARRSHEQAVRIDPEWTFSYYPLTTACARLGQREDAARYREKFAALKAADIETAIRETRDYDDLATQREAVVKRHVLAGMLWLREGEPRLAEAHWVRAVAISPDNAETYQALASLYEQQKRPAAEIAMLQPLIRLQTDQVKWPLRVGRLQLELGKLAEAEATLGDALRSHPRSAEAHRLLAELQLRSGRDLAAATRHAEQATRLEPSPQAYLLLAGIRADAGDRQGALESLKAALSLDPNNREIRTAYEQLARQ
jgi:tetratricopeptide (TPR) repeat protein